MLMAESREQAATALSRGSKRTQATQPCWSHHMRKGSGRSGLQSRTVLSSEPEAIREPLGEKTAERTQLQWPTREVTKRRSGKDDSFTILSSEAESTRRSSLEMSQARTGPKCALRMRGACFPAWFRHTATVASIEAVARSSPEADATMQVTPARWLPKASGRGRSGAKGQTSTVPSCEPVTTCSFRGTAAHARNLPSRSPFSVRTMRGSSASARSQPGGSMGPGLRLTRMISDLG
mmetsp:Transcript_88866/g.190781  ORF Transcript_88866/g.190781 Transcript_88866/m.190781 type:complete len:236 (-) Transcript_88866:219-926(-)